MTKKYKIKWEHCTSLSIDVSHEKDNYSWLLSCKSLATAYTKFQILIAQVQAH